MAHISFTGRIGTNPEIRNERTPKAVARFRVAEGHRKKDQNGQWQDAATTWRTVTLFGHKAEVAVQAFQKGDLVLVQGREQTEAWESNGEAREALVVLADEVAKVPTAPRQDQGGGYQQQRPQGGYPPQGGNAWDAQQGSIDAGQWGNGQDATPF